VKTPLPPLPEVPQRADKPFEYHGEGVTIQSAADYFGIDAKKLCGLIQRNALGDPFGNVFANWVYAWSVQRYLEAQQAKDAPKPITLSTGKKISQADLAEIVAAVGLHFGHG
jgi:hypothetical protein